MENQIELIEEIEKKYPNEWLVFEIIEMAVDGFTPLKGSLLAHGQDRDKVHEEALHYCKKHDIRNMYFACTGQIQVESILL